MNQLSSAFSARISQQTSTTLTKPASSQAAALQTTPAAAAAAASSPNDNRIIRLAESLVQSDIGATARSQGHTAAAIKRNTRAANNIEQRSHRFATISQANQQQHSSGHQRQQQQVSFSQSNASSSEEHFRGLFAERPREICIQRFVCIVWNLANLNS